MIKSLAAGGELNPGNISRVGLLGGHSHLKFTHDVAGLTVTLPEQKPNDYAYGLKINGLKWET